MSQLLTSEKSGSRANKSRVFERVVYCVAGGSTRAIRSWIVFFSLSSSSRRARYATRAQNSTLNQDQDKNLRLARIERQSNCGGDSLCLLIPRTVFEIGRWHIRTKHWFQQSRNGRGVLVYILFPHPPPTPLVTASARTADRASSKS